MYEPPNVDKKMDRMCAMGEEELCRFVAATAIREYLFDHPGCVYGPPHYRAYSPGFKRLIVRMTKPGEPCEKMAIDEIAQVTGVPDEFLERWLKKR